VVRQEGLLRAAGPKPVILEDWKPFHNRITRHQAHWQQPRWLCGVCAFLELYCTQPLLPLLARLFHASKTGVGMTVSAATLGVALAAPVFGALAERLPRKRVIVISLLGVSVPTLLAATSTSLAQLIFWRFLQGVTVPGIIAVVITYIGEEWPPDRVPLIMSFYVSGTALGGFLGRISSGILADRFSWRVSFLAGRGLSGRSGGGGRMAAARAQSRTASVPRCQTTEIGFSTRCKGSFATAGWWPRLPWASTCCFRWLASLRGSPFT
jgi:MFS family permease